MYNSRERTFVPSPQYIIGLQEDDRKQLYESNGHLTHYLSRLPQLRNVSIDVLQYTIDEKELYYYQTYDAAGRLSNELKLQILGNPDTRPPYAEVFVAAYQHPDISDHAHGHKRRVSLWAKKQLIEIEELKQQPGFVDYLKPAMLVTDFHDQIQIVNQYRNITEWPEGAQTPSPRTGHEAGGALMILAQYQKYAQAHRISYGEAYEICSKAAVLMMHHDSQEDVSHLFSGEKESATGLVGDELIQKFQSKSIDLTSITPAQLIEIVRAQTKVYQVNKSATGLHPAFEEEYKEILGELEDTKLPLMYAATQQDRDNLRLVGEVLYRADLWDMTTPPVHALMRTLAGAHSFTRAFLPDFTSQEDLSDFLSWTTETPLNIPSLLTEENRHLLPERFQGNPIGDLNIMAKRFSTDIRRSAAERIDKMPEDSLIGQSELVQRINRDSSLMGAWALWNLGTAVLNGPESYTHFIESHYQVRKSELITKAVRKAGLDNDLDRTLSTEEVEELLKDNAPNMYMLYTERAEGLVKEKNRVLDNLNGKYTTASPQQKEYFKTFMANYIKSIVLRYNISQQAYEELAQQYAAGQYQQDLPYRCYSELASRNEMRLIFEPEK